ncbi:class I SAM-dependent methyltransferase [Candidatus Peregrinibacteria bacterium]|nr:class I SAM-dependent methyltransferase [Candidatus Peregrinibacteria bacterium]
MSTDPTQQFYESHVREYEEQTDNLQPQSFLQKFMETLPRNSRLLDVGCAYGRDSAFLAEHGFKVTGVDYAAGLIERAKQRVPNAEFLVADMRELPFDSGSFDGIWAYMSLLHLQKSEVPAALQGFAHVLAPQGVFALGMKVGQGEGYVTDQRYDGAKKYFANFTENEMHGLLQQAGFHVLESSVRERQLPYQDLPVMEILARKDSTASRS